MTEQDASSQRDTHWRSAAPRPFRELPPLPPELRIPRPLALGLVLMTLGAGAAGALAAGPGALARLLEGLYRASLWLYLGSSVLDFWEHLRLERAVTGRYLAATVVPPGETLLHGAIGTVVLGLALLSREPAWPPTLRDWLVFSGPVLFLVLGWCDELIYHRRRALRREHQLHTLSHLAAGALLATLCAARMVGTAG